MKLNRELSQRCWLEVMRFAQDDSFGCRQLIRYCPFITSIFNFLDALAPRRDFSRGRCALRRELSQKSWQANSLGMQTTCLVMSILTSTFNFLF